MQSRVSAGLVTFGDATLDQDPSTIERQNTNVDLLVAAGNDKYLFGAGHRYNIFSIDPLPVASNGHLHTFFLPFHRVTGDDRSNFHIGAAAALSASSNGFKHSGDLGSVAFQLLGAITWSRQFSDKTGVRYGLCADHRFGEYRLYPTASLLWQPHPDWHAELGFPDAKLQYQVSDAVTSVLRVMPDGNEWFVLDRSRTTGSTFIYESYRVELAVDWKIHYAFVLNASIGRQLDNHYELNLLDQSQIKLSNDPVTRVGMSIEWQF